MSRELAIAVHDVEPATFERCALIRDWLDDHGVERVTLLVIPAADLHPLNDRCPELVEWLADRRARGDAIAQHGLHHRRLGGNGLAQHPTLRRIRGPRAEFTGLDAAETRAAVAAGRRVLHLAGVEPRGFVAPAYAYTHVLRTTLESTFDWWAGLMTLHRVGGRVTLAPVQRAGTLGRALGAGPLLRLDLHPADLDHPRHMLAIERLLRRAAKTRAAVTYDDLARTR
jgi:predicted deacetylase